MCGIWMDWFAVTHRDAQQVLHRVDLRLARPRGSVSAFGLCRATRHDLCSRCQLPLELSQ